MSSEDPDSKTEEASERKIREARAKGDSWSSREAGHLLSFLGLLIVCLIILPLWGPLLLLDLSRVFDTAGQTEFEDVEGLGLWLSDLSSRVTALLFPVLGLLFALGCLAAAMGGPLFVSLPRLQPKFSKLNPFSGLKRLVSKNNLVEFTKNILRVTLLSGAAFWVMRDFFDSLLPGAVLAAEDLLPQVAEAAVMIFILGALILLPFTGFDIFWKRRQWLRKQKMTKQDVKQEAKDSEGDPMIRARRQQLRRRALQRPHMQTVPEATLIITNPTHYAIALRYERGVDAAPVCLAKGTDLQALRIREIAFDNEIPVIESPPLARALYAGTEEEELIPEEHWAAVAELVGYVLDLRRRIRRRLPEGSHHLLR